MKRFLRFVLKPIFKPLILSLLAIPNFMLLLLAANVRLRRLKENQVRFSRPFTIEQMRLVSAAMKQAHRQRGDQGVIEVVGEYCGWETTGMTKVLFGVGGHVGMSIGHGGMSFGDVDLIGTITFETAANAMLFKLAYGGEQ